MELKINKEFQDLIPALSPDELKLLTESIIKDGVREPILIWNSFIIDGHNRYNICQSYNIPFETRELIFETEQDALIWIIKNQLGRRNLTDYSRINLTIQLTGILAEKAQENEQIAGKIGGLIGGRGNKKQDNEKEKGFPISENPFNQINTIKEIAKLAGVGHNTVSEVKNINKNAADEIKQELSKQDSKISINTASLISGLPQDKQLEIVNNNNKKEIIKIAQNIKDKIENKGTPTLPDKKYRVIYADPPWQYNDKMPAGYGAAENHYTTLSISELCNLPIKNITENNAVLFLWVTSPLLESSFEIIKAWGFKYKTSFIWDKIKHNIGHYNSVRHEFLLICTKGSCMPDNKKLYDSVISIERSDKHSEKPAEFINIIDDLYQTGLRIELFARKKTKDWDVWGNEI